MRPIVGDHVLDRSDSGASARPSSSAGLLATTVTPPPRTNHSVPSPPRLEPMMPTDAPARPS